MTTATAPHDGSYSTPITDPVKVPLKGQPLLPYNVQSAPIKKTITVPQHSIKLFTATLPTQSDTSRQPQCPHNNSPSASAKGSSQCACTVYHLHRGIDLCSPFYTSCLADLADTISKSKSLC